MNMKYAPVIGCIDVETTGIDPRKDMLLQVSLALVNWNFDLVDTPREWTVSMSEAMLRVAKGRSSDVVLEMHQKSGLWDKIGTGYYSESLKQIDEELSGVLAPVAEGKPVIMAGNSLTLDRNFMEEFLPQSFGVFSYRSIDLSSVALFLGSPSLEYPIFEKKLAHTAEADILETIDEAKHYLELVPTFKG